MVLGKPHLPTAYVTNATALESCAEAKGLGCTQPHPPKKYLQLRSTFDAARWPFSSMANHLCHPPKLGESFCQPPSGQELGYYGIDFMKAVRVVNLYMQTMLQKHRQPPPLTHCGKGLPFGWTTKCLYLEVWHPC